MYSFITARVTNIMSSSSSSSSSSYSSSSFHPSPPPPPFFLSNRPSVSPFDLPDEVLALVFEECGWEFTSSLERVNRAASAAVCRWWRTYVDDVDLWLWRKAQWTGFGSSVRRGNGRTNSDDTSNINSRRGGGGSSSGSSGGSGSSSGSGDNSNYDADLRTPAIRNVSYASVPPSIVWQHALRRTWAHLFPPTSTLALRYVQTHARALRTLSLREWGIVNADVWLLLRNNTRLVHLDLSRCFELTFEGEEQETEGEGVHNEVNNETEDQKVVEEENVNNTTEPKKRWDWKWTVGMPFSLVKTKKASSSIPLFLSSCLQSSSIYSPPPRSSNSPSSPSSISHSFPSSSSSPQPSSSRSASPPPLLPPPLRLETLVVSECTLACPRALERLVSRCPSLSHLDLSFCELVDDVLVATLGTACPLLFYLSLALCTRVSDVSGVVSQCRSLSYLNLNLTRVTTLGKNGGGEKTESATSTSTEVHNRSTGIHNRSTGIEQRRPLTLVSSSPPPSLSLTHLSVTRCGVSSFVDVATERLVSLEASECTLIDDTAFGALCASCPFLRRYVCMYDACINRSELHYLLHKYFLVLFLSDSTCRSALD